MRRGYELQLPRAADVQHSVHDALTEYTRTTGFADRVDIPLKPVEHENQRSPACDVHAVPA